MDRSLPGNFQKIPWKREWQLTPVLLPGNSMGRLVQESGRLCLVHGVQRVGHDLATQLQQAVLGKITDAFTVRYVKLGSFSDLNWVLLDVWSLSLSWGSFCFASYGLSSVQTCLDLLIRRRWKSKRKRESGIWKTSWDQLRIYIPSFPTIFY